MYELVMIVCLATTKDQCVPVKIGQFDNVPSCMSAFMPAAVDFQIKNPGKQVVLGGCRVFSKDA